jgi:hypothetical protein
MIGEPDAGKPHVRFDEGVQETCDIAARLRPTLRIPLAGCGAAPRVPYRALLARHTESRPPHQAASANTKFAKSSNTQLFFRVR